VVLDHKAVIFQRMGVGGTYKKITGMQDSNSEGRH